jgi:hypothetical protein
MTPWAQYRIRLLADALLATAVSTAPLPTLQMREVRRSNLEATTVEMGSAIEPLRTKEEAAPTARPQMHIWRKSSRPLTLNPQNDETSKA